mmetsp:Transcript_48340/g.134394  ORF Transcript_48340/g.134394 Transcript_48340/m.134394 type:complete len:197 (-) Transcript_48340:38-628(-)
MRLITLCRRAASASTVRAATRPRGGSAQQWRRGLVLALWAALCSGAAHKLCGCRPWARANDSCAPAFAPGALPPLRSPHPWQQKPALLTMAGAPGLRLGGPRKTMATAAVAEDQDGEEGTDGEEEKIQYADDVMPEVTGAVRLYATHTLCISCLACCCQFKRLLPNVKLEVAFDVWRETRRWVGTPEDLTLPHEEV